MSRITLAFLFGFSLLAGNFSYATDSDRVVLVLGDSLSAGYGLNATQAYPAILQQKIDDQGLNAKVVNGGVSGDTSAGGLRRIDWFLREEIDVLLLELGANDGLRGIPLDSTKANLQGIIEKTLQHSPRARIVIAGMMVPPNLGPIYTERFKKLFEELAEENRVGLIPFLLEKVAGRRELNLADGIHPNAQGHRLVAETVWEILEPILRSPAKPIEQKPQRPK
jgi:acyl-CoA thioesterase-1